MKMENNYVIVDTRILEMNVRLKVQNKMIVQIVADKRC